MPPTFYNHILIFYYFFETFLLCKTYILIEKWLYILLGDIFLNYIDLQLSY